MTQEDPTKKLKSKSDKRTTMAENWPQKKWSMQKKS